MVLYPKVNTALLDALKKFSVVHVNSQQYTAARTQVLYARWYVMECPGLSNKERKDLIDKIASSQLGSQSLLGYVKGWWTGSSKRAPTPPSDYIKNAERQGDAAILLLMDQLVDKEPLCAELVSASRVCAIAELKEAIRSERERVSSRLRRIVAEQWNEQARRNAKHSLQSWKEALFLSTRKDVTQALQFPATGYE